MQQALDDLQDSRLIDEDETRSLCAEIDYTKKDATRHIVSTQGQGSGDKLRQKLLRNLEGVRKNKPILKSEASVIKSIRSRASNVTARQSQAAQIAATLDAGRLSKISEIDGENKDGTQKCEACTNCIAEDDDIAMCDEISKQL